MAPIHKKNGTIPNATSETNFRARISSSPKQLPFSQERFGFAVMPFASLFSACSLLLEANCGRLAIFLLLQKKKKYRGYHHTGAKARIDANQHMVEIGFGNADEVCRQKQHLGGSSAADRRRGLCHFYH
ncbi:hypothetical protein [Bradyrhizobium oligotrophicum]|uniref:hypothetical protein n=1 Tax=Bradyrhizobium oligotrophicum TaxID=44255 RepID=UPI003EBDC10F